MSDEVEPLDVDVLVVGHGMAGLMSASLLASRGYEVAAVGKGMTATSLSTGCLTTYRNNGDPLNTSTVDTGHLSNSVYPYSLSGGDSGALERELTRINEFFVPRMEDQGLHFEGSWEERHSLINQIGTVYQCSLGPNFSLAGNAKGLQEERVALLGLMGYQVFDPDLASRTINELFEGAGVRPYWMQLSAIGSRNHFGASEVARLPSEELIAEMIEGVSDLSEDRVGVPPLFGLKDFNPSMSKIEEETGRKVFEVITPLSLPGKRLQEGMENMARKEGVVIYKGWEATECEIEDGEVVGVTIKNPTRSRKTELSGLVLASGDVITRGKAGGRQDGGLNAFHYGTGHQDTGTDPVAMLWSKVNEGVLVDERLHPMVDERTSVQNAVATGGVLPGFSFAGGVGLSGSMYTSLKAAEWIEEDI